MGSYQKILDLSNRFQAWLHPIEITPSKEVIDVLTTIYPTVKWENVHFYQGLPWHILESKASAVALPGIYDTKKVHLYFKNWNPKDVYGVGLIVHEAMHVYQYSLIGLKGLGFLRPFMIRYFSLWLKHRSYYRHPMEEEAFEQERLFVQYFIDSMISLEQKDVFIDKKIKEHKLLTTLIQTSTAVEMNDKYPSGTFYQFLAFLMAVHIAVLIPIIELFLRLFNGGLKLMVRAFKND